MRNEVVKVLVVDASEEVVEEVEGDPMSEVVEEELMTVAGEVEDVMNVEAEEVLKNDGEAEVAEMNVEVEEEEELMSVVEEVEGVMNEEVEEVE
jgi:hypothetical protein